MTRSRRDIRGEMTIDGVLLRWYLHREQQLSTEDGLRGICIHVQVADAVYRELYIEYAPVDNSKPGQLRATPFRPTILKAKVEAHILEAIEIGFRLKSRGKPMIYFPDELPC